MNAALSDIPQLMLYGETPNPFDHPNYLFEFKYTGIRCLALIEKDQTHLFNKYGRNISANFPELAHIYWQVNKPCILDGELVITSKSHVQDLAAVLYRQQLKRQLLIENAAQKTPATLIATDILRFDNHDLAAIPLAQRKALLDKNIRTRNIKLTVAQLVSGNGVWFYAWTKRLGLDGIIAKDMFSKYHSGQFTDRWQSILHYRQTTLCICGYLASNRQPAIKIILADRPKLGCLIYRGYTKTADSALIVRLLSMPAANDHPFEKRPPVGFETAIWLQVPLKCEVNNLPAVDNCLRNIRLREVEAL